VVIIRPATKADARGILEAHYSAVHETASKDYDADILDEWSTVVSEERISNYLLNSFPNEITIVAVVYDKIAGFGSLAGNDELRAVYVASNSGGKSIGSALLQRLEEIAKDKGFTELKMDSSVTAEKFYAKHGYEITGRGIHKLRSGREMACVHMRKSLV